MKICHTSRSNCAIVNHHASIGKHCSHQIACETANGMYGKYIYAVVEAKDRLQNEKTKSAFACLTNQDGSLVYFQLSSIIAGRPSDEAESQ